MAEKNEPKMVEVELHADGMRLDGRNYGRGDVVSIPEDQAELLREHGVVGDKGSLEKADEAAQDRDEAEARRQRYLSGLSDADDEPVVSPESEDYEEPRKRGPGRPRKDGSPAQSRSGGSSSSGSSGSSSSGSGSSKSSGSTGSSGAGQPRDKGTPGGGSTADARTRPHSDSSPGTADR